MRVSLLKFPARIEFVYICIRGTYIHELQSMCFLGVASYILLCLLDGKINLKTD